MLALLFGLASPGAAQTDPVRTSASDFRSLEATPADDDAFARLIAGLPAVHFDDAGTKRTFYVWEGDMLLDEDEIRAVLFARLSAVPARGSEELLLQVRGDGQPGIWKRGKRNISYAVDCSTFTDDPAQCANTRQKMASAAKDWVKSCTGCGVNFRELTVPAGTVPSDEGPHFVVRYEPDQYDYIAIAFFANDPAYKRYVSVTPSFFTTTFDPVGVLRHELGHVLGYRHEHTQKIKGCHYEDNRWKALTEYDSQSVMHYFCGGGGTKALTLSRLDKQGHRAAYGAK